ncbi:hypothetical protein SEA_PAULODIABOLI_331 [Microbacterium phage PauloDiaboli]|nr:hypothetical protein SEA_PAULODIABOLI_331 [Microbacterium phage PauloDiaboli]
MSDVWAEIDRNLEGWRKPAEGAVALEAWSRFNGVEDAPMGYMVVPLRGDWASAVEDGELERAIREGARVDVSAYAVNVFEGGQWNRRVVWSRDGGVRWLES